MNMTIAPQTFHLLENRVVFDKAFVPEQTDLEIVDNESEKTYIKDNHYHIENLTQSRWNYYKHKIPDHTGENWTITSNIEILSKEQFSHCGLVWGFNEEKEYLNRFTISADGKRAVVMHFQKDHNRVFHRYQKKIALRKNAQPIELTICKLNSYFYFLLNRELIYLCEKSHFAEHGSYFGFYIEPGLHIRSSSISVHKLTLKEYSKNGFECLFF
jgi:hypothetical protein